MAVNTEKEIITMFNMIDGIHLTLPATGGRGLFIEYPHDLSPPSWFHIWRSSGGAVIFIGRLQIVTDFFAARSQPPAPSGTRPTLRLVQ